MEYIDILGIVYDVWVDDVPSIVKYEMKKRIRRIELSNDKDTTIKSIISSLDYERCLIGRAYIANNYEAGNTVFDIREWAADFYFNKQKWFKPEVFKNVVKEDVLEFFTLLRQEIELRKLLAKSGVQKEYDEGLIKLFKGHKDLIALLIGKSDHEIAKLINTWARETDKRGNSLIENPHNRLKKEYAEALKKTGLIQMSTERFRAIL